MHLSFGLGKFFKSIRVILSSVISNLNGFFEIIVTPYRLFKEQFTAVSDATKERSSFPAVRVKLSLLKVPEYIIFDKLKVLVSPKAKFVGDMEKLLTLVLPMNTMKSTLHWNDCKEKKD